MMYRIGQMTEERMDRLFTVTSLYDLQHTLAGDYLNTFQFPWEALDGIRSLILELGPKLSPEYIENVPGQWIHRTAEIAASAELNGPCIIGPETQVRHGAFIRGSALVGRGCVVGNSVELKNVILFDGVQVPHYNYVGDSILGYKAHMGAGAVTSNIKSDKTNIVVRGEEPIATGRRKLGAMIGDFAEIGCNAVLNPGTVIGRRVTVYPTSCVRGTVPEDSIWKNTGEIIRKRELHV